MIEYFFLLSLKNKCPSFLKNRIEYEINYLNLLKSKILISILHFRKEYILSKLYLRIVILLSLQIVNIFAQQTTITLQEKWSGTKCEYNVEDIAFNWEDAGRDPRAYYWFQDCPL